MRLRAFLVVAGVLAWIASFPIRGEDAPAGGLKLLHTGAPPAGIDLAQVDALADRCAGGDEAAEKEVLARGPLAALSLQHRADTDKDAAVRARLEKLRDRVCADSAALADQVFRYGQALATCDASGPLNWEDPKVLELRGEAKFFHLCFIETKVQGEAWRYPDADGGMFEPFRDLPSAGGLYRVAGDMYDRLAKAATAKEDAAKLSAEAEKCRKAAAKAEGEGARVR